MATALFILILFLHAPIATLSLSASDWCRTVPHTAACLSHLPHATPAIHRSQFFRLSVQAALDLAISARARVNLLRTRRARARDKPAWIDCSDLFADAVFQLNRSLSPPHVESDAQTWISAALTDILTCSNGFADLCADSSIIRPITRGNLSELISNCLAINGGWPVEGPVRPAVWTGGLVSGRADFVVAKDGSGNFGTIKAAVDSAERLRRRTGRRIWIYVKRGVYEENIDVRNVLNDLTIRGDGKGKTIITAGRSVAGGFTTFSSPTVRIFGDGFMGTGLTIRNTFGPGSQAVALLSGSDRSVFYKCSIEGYQDTLCVYTQRQFYRECDIFGTIDFIFGNSAAVIQNSTIFVRTPLNGESNVITAHGRTDRNQNTAIVIHFSSILPAPDFRPAHGSVKSYLGRPWKLFARTVYMQSFIHEIIDPAGWLPFDGGFALDTLYYAEFRNTGPGARVLRNRVKWKGFHLICRASEVQMFTVGKLIAGGTWLPATGVPFAAGV